MRNNLEKALDKVTGHGKVEYHVFIEEKEGSKQRLVGIWNTQKQANAHKNRMVDSGKFHSVEWELIQK